MENFSPSSTAISYHTDPKETPNIEGSSQIIFWLYCFEDLLEFKLLILLFRSKNSLSSPHESQLIYESYEVAVQVLLLITNPFSHDLTSLRKDRNLVLKKNVRIIMAAFMTTEKE